MVSVTGAATEVNEMKFRLIPYSDRTVIRYGEYIALRINERYDEGFLVYHRDEIIMVGIPDEQHCMSAIAQYAMECDPRLTHNAQAIIN